MTKRWKKFASREGVDLTTISLMDEVFYDLFWNYTKIKNEVFFTTLKNENFTHYITLDLLKVSRFYYYKYFNSPKTIEKYYKNGLEILNENKKIVKKWQKYLCVVDSQRLSKVLDDFCKNYQPVNYLYSIKSFFIIEGWQTDLDSIVSKLIKKNKLESKKSQIRNSIYQSWKKTAIIELQEKVNSGVDTSKLVKEYQFLRNWSVVWNKSIDKNWIRNLTSDKKTLQFDKLYTFEQLVILLKPNRKEKYFLQMAPYMIFFKDWRDDLRREFVYIWSFLFDKIAQFLKISREGLGYLTMEEITQALSGKNFKRVIELRKNNICLVTINGKQLKIKVIDSPLPEKYQKIINGDAKTEDNQEIKGLVAQAGIARGKVKIINSFHDIKKLKAGEILVANTTHPNYLPAMKIASAFVTNEGGVICHAAIVARELKKPCIVGTKIATKVLNGGDLVEVDANKGIVTKIR